MIKLKPIKPDLDNLTPRRYERAIKTALGIVAVTALQEFKQTTRTWDHKPDFRIDEEGDRATIGTSDKVYGYVDEGTRPHDIRPRRGRVLRFGVGGSPKTTPGSLTAGRGSPGLTIHRPRVRHPGTKARGFSKMIRERAEERLPGETERQLRKAAE